MLNKCYVDLIQLVKNAKNIRKKLPSSTKFYAVVKANAYGHGAEVVSSSLYQYVDGFCVALLEEGVALRNSGIDKDVLILIPVLNCEMERAIKYNFTLTISNLNQLKILQKTAKILDRRVNVHIKYNTGMNRLGVDSIEELKEIIRYAKKSKYVNITGLYTHYQKPQDKKLLKKATNKFLLAIKVIKDYNNSIICHASASGGFLMGQYFDMVRIGILLYGYKPFSSDLLSVKPIMKITSPILAKRQLLKGQNSLYGNVKSQKPTNISLVRYGYADGLERRQIQGQFNNRCMDISALEGNEKKRDVLIMSDAESLAKRYKTISYEVLSKVSMRAEKIYKK